MIAVRGCVSNQRFRAVLTREPTAITPNVRLMMAPQYAPTMRLATTSGMNPTALPQAKMLGLWRVIDRAYDARTPTVATYAMAVIIYLNSSPASRTLLP